MCRIMLLITNILFKAANNIEFGFGIFGFSVDHKMSTFIMYTLKYTFIGTVLRIFPFFLILFNSAHDSKHRAYLYGHDWELEEAFWINLYEKYFVFMLHLILVVDNYK